jgi:hypothetical protein
VKNLSVPLSKTLNSNCSSKSLWIRASDKILKCNNNVVLNCIIKSNFRTVYSIDLLKSNLLNKSNNSNYIDFNDDQINLKPVFGLHFIITFTNKPYKCL